MSIPEGYRLLTKDDVGKVFGTDLELEVYIDDTVQPSFYPPDDYGSTTINLTNFIELIIGYGYPPYDDFTSTEENTIRLNQSAICTHWINSSAFGYNDIWYITDYTFTDNVEITSFNTDMDWNNWFYVKDKPDPYNIKLTEPKLTIHCEGATMEKDVVVQVDVYDGTVEGGEVESGGGAKNFTLTIETEYADASTISSIQYSVDGNDLVDTGITTAPYGPVTYNLKGSSILIAIKGSGGLYERSVEITGGKLIPFYSSYTYAYNNFCYYCAIEEENANINIVLYTD